MSPQFFPSSPDPTESLYTHASGSQACTCFESSRACGARSKQSHEAQFLLPMNQTAATTAVMSLTVFCAACSSANAPVTCSARNSGSSMGEGENTETGPARAARARRRELYIEIDWPRAWEAWVREWTRARGGGVESWLRFLRERSRGWRMAECVLKRLSIVSTIER